MDKKYTTALRGTLIYTIIGGLWILLSDLTLGALISEPAIINRLQTYKGWFYVVVTAIVLFVLLKRAINNTEKLLTLDPLTQLPRHYQFTQILDDQLARLTKKDKIVLMYIDINHFSQLNQEHGHKKGDEVLKKITGELWESFHEDCIVGRLGSDQFGIAKKINKRESFIEKYPEEVFHLVQTVSEELQIPLNISIGIAIAPQDGLQSKTLLLAASMALHNAKQQGEEQFSFYSRKLSEVAEQRQRMVRELKSNQLMSQFSLVYQPQISLDDEGICGVEVLLRWTHPEMGFVSPADFIPVAEEIGIMPKISRWVIRHAKLELESAGLIPEPINRVSINISAKELHLEAQMKNLQGLLREEPEFAKICQLEITETSAIYDISTSHDFIRNLKQLGVKFSIDDFGTGFTSLSNLKNLPVDELKIDRSFIDKIETEKSSQIIVKSIIDLSRNFGISSIAEGVENENQLAFLRQCQCKEAQGYYFARPAAIQELRETVCKSKLLRKATGR